MRYEILETTMLSPSSWVELRAPAGVVVLLGSGTPWNFVIALDRRLQAVYGGDDAPAADSGPAGAGGEFAQQAGFAAWLRRRQPPWSSGGLN